MRPSVRVPMIVILALAMLAGTGARALAAPGVLKVCQDPNNLPFSNERGEGFENRIAQLLADKLGWKLEYFSFPQRMGFIRNTLRFKLPGEQYRCDLVIGVPAKWDQAATTQPYYHSTYALVYPENGKLAGVHSAKDLYARDPASLRALRIAAVVWGPIAGYFAKRIAQPKMVVVPLPSEPDVKFDYQIAMGVRFGEPKWKASVERLIDENRAGIEAILREYGVPLLDVQPEGKS